MIRDPRIRAFTSSLLFVFTLFFFFLHPLFLPFSYGKVSIIPLPAFSTSRNEGEDYGILTAFLFLNEREEIHTLVAPLVIYNGIEGVSGRVNLFRFFPGDRQYRLVLSYSSKINRRVSFFYEDPQLSGGLFAVKTGLNFFKRSTARFFGFTDWSREEDETNFTHKELSATLSLGVNISRYGRLSWGERFRRVQIGQGGVNVLPFIGGLFPDVRGVSGATILGHRLTFLYDTRDEKTTPTTGLFVETFVELGQDLKSEKSSFFSRYHLEVTQLISTGDRRFVHVVRGVVELTGGSEVPFFERSTLGGEETLRGFGRNRFIDDNLVLLNIEERIRVFVLRLFGVVSEWQVAPFLDMGKVLSSFSWDRFPHGFQFNGGVGVRAIVSPTVVGRVDLGFGREGMVAFVGIDYPF